MYPTRNQYKISVLNEMYPSEENGGYSFEPIILNNELVIASGGNATVFKLKDNKGNIKAVKFFTEPIDSRFTKYSSISNFLKNHSFLYLVNFTFVKDLIFVPIDGQSEDENKFPGLVMDWIDAPTLDSKITQLVSEKNKQGIKDIAFKFKEMAISILSSGYAHGDLKLSNLLIDEDNNLFLIDYDGMYIPEFKGETSPELGTPSYQHPKRTIHHYNERIDDFSIIIIYTSLLALSEDLGLFKYNDGDNIIFTLEDFENYQFSDVFKKLASSETTKGYVSVIIESISSNYIKIPNLINILKGIYPLPEIIEFTSNHNVVTENSSIILTWNIAQANKVEIGNGIGTVDSAGSTRLIINKSCTLKLIAYGHFGKVEREIDITVFPTPIINEILVPFPIVKINSIIEVSTPTPTKINAIDYKPIAVSKFKMEVNTERIDLLPNTVNLKYNKITFKTRVKNIYKAIIKEIKSQSYERTEKE